MGGEGRICAIGLWDLEFRGVVRGFVRQDTAH